MKKSTKAIVSSLSIAAGAVAASAAVGYAAFNEVMNRNAKIYPAVAELFSKKVFLVNKNNEDERILWFNEQKPINYEMIDSRGLRLKARMIPAEKESNVYVFCSHGYRSSGVGEFGIMTKFYHDLGYNVFMVDHAAHGESDGKYIGFGYHEYKDCLEWLNWMLEKFGDDIQLILHGISMGCATVTMMSGDENLPKNVKFIVADCGYTSTKDEFNHDLKSLLHLYGAPIINSANFFNKAINGFDFDDASPIKAVAKAKVPMLFIHGDSDTFVPTYMVHQLYAACTSEYKDLLLIKGAGHAESYRTDSASYEAKVKEFADKFID